MRVTAGSGDGGAVDAVYDGYGGSTDLSASIVFAKDDGLSYEATLWNLADDTWHGVSEGDPCRISLGWDGGNLNHVLYGVVNIKRMERQDRDIKYTLKGVDETDALTKARITKTWRDRSPSQIAEGIARELGLTPGRIDESGGTLEGDYAITEDEPAQYWLDQLKSEAEKITDTQWEWFCQAGQLFFERKDSDTAQATVLSFDNTLLSIGEAAGTSDSEDSEGDLEFEALCEPDIQKNSLVAVDTDRFSGVYKVIAYSFTSDSTNGDHKVRGTITPAGSQYEWSRLSTGGGSGIDWSGRDSGTAG